MPDRPAVRTVANVEVLSVGTWDASTGKFTATMDDLAAAVAAYDDSGYTTPVLKIGHTDARFNPGDGQPALGRLVNPRLSEDKQTLLVDLAGVPTWLADMIDGQRADSEGANAFPNRSIEGQFNLKTQTGTTHQFALTGLALLGTEFPAISTLADIASLYGLDPVAVAAAAAKSLEEDPMPKPVEAAVSLDQVRQSFYSSAVPQALQAPYAWVREVYTDKIIVDDDNGSLYSVPWKAKGNDVEFGDPAKVAVEYVAAAADAEPEAARAGALRARLAFMSHDPETAPATLPSTEPPVVVPKEKEGAAVPFELTAEQEKALREKLGLDEDADSAALLAALTNVPAPVAAGAPHSLPQGAVVVDAATLEAMQADGKAGRLALARLDERERDTLLDEAVSQGKIALARKEHYAKAWSIDAEGTKAALAAMPKNLVPVAPLGYGGSEEDGPSEFDGLFAPTAQGA